MNRLNLLLILVAALLVAAYASWLLDTFRPTRAPAETARHDVPDYYLDGLEARRFDADGRLRQRLLAARALHFPRDGRVHLSHLQLTVPAEGAPWQLTAEAGEITGGGDRIRLPGAVHAQRDAHGRQPTLRLDTRDLLVLPAASRAETAAPATLRAGPHRMAGTGLVLDWKRRRLQLLADVESRYVLAP